MPVCFRRLFVVAFVVFLSATPVSAQSVDARRIQWTDALTDEITQSVDAAVTTGMQRDHLPGVAIVVVRDGKTIFKRGYGFANLEQNTKVDPDQTLFRIGSISKALTFLTLTRLTDDGRIAMNDDVERYFSGIQNPYGFRSPVTIKHLLTHTGGFDQIGGDDRQVKEFEKNLADRKAMRQNIADYLGDNRLRRVTKPGEMFRYDTYGSTLAGAIIERVTKLPFPEAMRQEMFQTLGMRRSFVEADDDQLANLATGYGFVDEEFVPQPYEVFVTTPASSIDATPSDMGRLLEALTSDGANSYGRLLKSSTTESVLSPQYRVHPEFVGTTHGLFESYTSRGEEFNKHVRTVGHGGSMRGFIASLTIVPEYRLGIFFATNRAPESGGGPINVDPILESVIAKLPGLQSRSPYPVPEKQNADLSEFAGDYYYGVFCHACSAEQVADGSWQRGRPRTVTASKGALQIADEEYLPRGEDVFVRKDGGRMVFFKRNEFGEISHFVYSTSSDAFERPSEQHPYVEFQSLAQAVYNVTLENGVGEALNRFQSLKAGGQHYLREEEMNNVGYALLQSQRVEDAVKIFRLNIAEFPQSWNAYDSLGEAYKTAGKTRSAIQNYRKSIELNPNNSAGKAVLQELEAN